MLDSRDREPGGARGNECLGRSMATDLRKHPLFQLEVVGRRTGLRQSDTLGGLTMVPRRRQRADPSSAGPGSTRPFATRKRAAGGRRARAPPMLHALPHIVEPHAHNPMHAANRPAQLAPVFPAPMIATYSLLILAPLRTLSGYSIHPRKRYSN